MPLTFFPFHLFKILHLPRKSSARSYEVQHLSRKIILANLKIWCSKVQPFSRNQRPDLLTSLMNMLLVLRLPRDMHLCGSSSNVPRLPTFFETATKPSRFAHFDQDAESRTPATRNNIWTSKSAPNPSFFYIFDFETCFAPQRRALFRHLTQVPKVLRRWCVFFLLRNVLRATTTCTFSTSQFLKVLRSWRALYILNSKCASHHNGVQFFISHLVRWLRTRRCSEPTLRPSGATNHAKNTVHRDFSLRTCILFLLTLSLLWSSLFFSSLLWLFPPLLFPSVHIVGSLTSKFLLETMKFLAELSWIIQTRPGTYPLGLPDNAATTREKNAGSRKNANVNLLFAKNGHLQMKEFRSTAVHPKSSKFPYIIIQNIWIYIYIIIYIKLDRYIFLYN